MITGRQFHVPGHAGLHLFDHALQIAPGDVGHDDDLALHVLAVDEVRPAIIANLGQRRQRQTRSARRGDQRRADRVEVVARGRVIAHHQVKAGLSLHHLGHRQAVEGHLDILGQLFRRKPVLRQRLAPVLDGQERNFGLLFGLDIDRPLDLFHHALDLLRQPAQLGQIVAEYLDGNIGPATRQHVIDTVRDRLADDDLDAGQLGEILAQGAKELLLAARPHLQTDFEFRLVHIERMRIERRASGTPRRGDHFGMRQQHFLDQLPEPGRFRQRGARQRLDANCQRALVEVRQKSLSRHAQRRQRHHQQGRAADGNRFPPGHGSVQHSAIARAQPVHETRFMRRGDFLGGPEEHRSQHRRHRDRHQQRGEQGNDIGQPERHHQAPLDPREKEQRHKNQHDDQRGEDDGTLNFLGRQKYHVHGRFAFPRVLLVVLAQAPDHVLDHDDGIIDQRAQGNGDAAQGHGVDRCAEHLERQDGGHQRQRQRHQGDRRRAHRKQEGEDDGDDKDRPVAQRRHQVGNRDFDKVGLTEQPGFDLHPRRQ